MPLKTPINPFPVTTYYGPKYFCDRIDEIRTLEQNYKNGMSTTLISLRRMGKTGLIQHLFYKMPQGYQGIYIDILGTENLAEFLNQLTSALLKSVQEHTSIGQKIWNFIKQFRPVIQFDPLTGAPQVSFDIRHDHLKPTIQSVFQFLDNQKFKSVIAIDEFQQIIQYKEQNTDAWLRSIIQQLKNTVFIFSGSQQHIMSELFASPSRPFYRSTVILKLDKIERQLYQDFIIHHFKSHHKKLSKEVANDILDWTDVYTFYVQLLCNRVFAYTDKTVTAETWKNQANILLKEHEQIFFSYRNLLTGGQWQLLCAIAMEERTFHPTSKKFLKKYDLGTSASVLRALDSLLKYEMIYYDYDDNGEKYYAIYDLLFKRWITNKYKK